MNTFVIERSTENQTLAMIDDDDKITSCTLEGSVCRSGDWVAQAKEFVGKKKPGRIIVGIGPGSFAGIRAALAFAQGYALGSSAKVFGLPSPCACGICDKCAVVGDARRELVWIALFDNAKMQEKVFRVKREELYESIPKDCRICSPDDKRIGEFLKETFNSRYSGFVMPAAESLANFAMKNEELLIEEPLPIYLNPAVRT